MQEKKLKVDVIIPTYKPDEKFDVLIERLQMQSYKINKIIIINTNIDFIDSEKYDNISNLEIHHINFDEFDHGTTRNYGVSFSDADIVIFMTQDAVPANKNLIEEIICPFEDEDVVVSYGRQIPCKNCSPSEAFTRQFNYPEFDIVKTKEDIPQMGIKAYFSSDVCAAYKREIQIELGGFPKTIFNEDAIFASKVINAGKKVYYASKAVVIHSHNYSYMQQFHRNFDIGVSHKQFSEIFGTVKSENEGIKLVSENARYLIKKKKVYLIPDLIIKSGFKYVGYRMGKLYNKLPEKLVLKCTLSRGYWLANKTVNK